MMITPSDAQFLERLRGACALLDKEEGAGAALVIAVGWRDAYAHNLDEDAARSLLEVVHETAAAYPDNEGLDLIVWARGGHARFADAAHHILAHHRVRRVYVVGAVDGVGTLLALLGEEIIMGEGARLGAPAVGPLGPPSGAWDADLVARAQARFWEVPEPDRLRMLQVLARRRDREALTATLRRWQSPMLTTSEEHDALCAALSLDALGEDVGLGAAQLAAHGVCAEAVVPASTRADALWRIRIVLEEWLGLRQKPAPSYTEAELGNEVEFEMATGVTSGIIASSSEAMMLSLDTGRPDPDTGLYAGEWKPMAGE